MDGKIVESQNLFNSKQRIWIHREHIVLLYFVTIWFLEQSTWPHHSESLNAFLYMLQQPQHFQKNLHILICWKYKLELKLAEWWKIHFVIRNAVGSKQSIYCAMIDDQTVFQITKRNTFFHVKHDDHKLYKLVKK